VTDARGHLEIAALPGRYRLSIRQPAGGLTRDLEVVVEPGRSTRVDVDFTTEDLDPAGPASPKETAGREQDRPVLETLRALVERLVDD